MVLLLQGVDRTANAFPAAVQNVSVNHRCFHILMPEQLLHGADVVTVGQKMRGEGMAESVAGRPLSQSGVPLRGVTLLVEEDEPLDPSDVYLLSSPAVMPCTDCQAHPIKQLG